LQEAYTKTRECLKKLVLPTTSLEQLFQKCKVIAAQPHVLANNSNEVVLAIHAESVKSTKYGAVV
jgi:hypothetical protein